MSILIIVFLILLIFLMYSFYQDYSVEDKRKRASQLLIDRLCGKIRTNDVVLEAFESYAKSYAAYLEYHKNPEIYPPEDVEISRFLDAIEAGISAYEQGNSAKISLAIAIIAPYFALDESVSDFIEENLQNTSSKLISEEADPETVMPNHEPIDQEPHSRDETKALRNASDIMTEFGLSDDEFNLQFSSYKFSLSFFGDSSNWNDDIEDFARSINALSEEEINLAKTSFEQAILNRIIVRNVASLRAKENLMNDEEID